MSRQAPKFVRVGILVLAALPMHAGAPTPTATTTTDRLDAATYLEWETVADPQLSPNGRQIVYTRRWVDKMKDEWESSLYIVDADGRHERFLVKGSEARWSPDGTR